MPAENTDQKPPLLLRRGPPSVYTPVLTRGREPNHSVSRDAQTRYMGPKMEALRESLDSAKLRVQTNNIGATDEFLLAIELRPGVTSEAFYEALASVGVESADVVEEIRTEPPDPVHMEAGRIDSVKSHVYLTGATHEVVQNLLDLWDIFASPRPLPRGKGAWRPVFMKCRTIRAWDVDDRADEGVRSYWESLLAHGRVPFEIDLMYRSSPERRATSERRLEEVIASSGARRISPFLILNEIAYHGVLVEADADSIRRMLAAPHDIALLTCDDVFQCRPAAQADCVSADTLEDIPAEVAVEPVPPGPLPAQHLQAAARVAVLDGLPIAGHPKLAGRVIVDDPDDWAPTYESGYRIHGTAMTSVVLNGDLSDPSGNPHRGMVYCRPILKPNLALEPVEERAPLDRLWIDVVHAALFRLLDEAAPGHPGQPISVVNLSVGDMGRAYSGRISPMARLLDWFAWKYKVLFVLSAGNHSVDVNIELNHEGQLFPPQQTAVLQWSATNVNGRSLLAPAEAINGITVGSANHDFATFPHDRLTDARVVLPIQDSEFPSPTSAIGPGACEAIKPDFIAPGGRFSRRLVHRTGQLPELARPIGNLQPMYGPGIKAAAPARFRNGERYDTGSSYAAAMVTHRSLHVLDLIDTLVAQDEHGLLRDASPGLLCKTLLVHQALRKESYGPLNDSQRGLSAHVGYGAIGSDRIYGGPSRVSLVGTGVVSEMEIQTFNCPIPADLRQAGLWRRIVATLCWFSPIAPRRREYVATKLKLVVPDGDNDHAENPFAARIRQVKTREAHRGTAAHFVLERRSNTGIHADLPDTWECSVVCERLDRSLLDAGIRIPYAIAITVEVSEGSGVDVYELVRQAVTPRVAIQPR